MELIEDQDKVIFCKDCCEEFVWTRGEQLFYSRKGFPPPKRCLDCRRELKLKKREDRRKVREVQLGK
jgi:hypothetical protein